MTQPAPILGFDEDELYEARVFQEASKPQQLTGQRALEAFAKGVGKMLEFGVKGMKWGVRHERPTTGRPPGPVPGTVEQTGKSVMPKPKTPLTAPKPQAPGLAEDPRTLSMMTVGKSAQLALNRKSGRQDINAPSADLHQGIAPKTRKSVSREPATLKPKRRTGFESRMQSFSAAVESGHRAGLREAKKPYIYYARPLQKYGSKAEEAEIAAIKEAFPGHRVMALTSCSKKRRGMGYYHGKVDGAAAVIISPRSGRHVTAGVYSEAQHALHNKIPVMALRKGRLKAVKRMKTLGGRPRGNFGKFVIKRKRRA